MNPKTRNILSLVLMGIPSLMMIASAIAKLAQAAPVVETLSKLHLGDKVLAIGVLELVCVVIYLIPRTMNIGFFLICSYWGGAIAADLTGGYINPTPVVILILFWVATWFRKPQLFF